MTCREFIDFLWQYLSDELPPGTRGEFDRHLSVCPECVEYLRSYRQIVRLGREAYRHPDRAVPPSVPEELVRAILAARTANGYPGASHD